MSEDFTSEDIATLDDTITKCYAALMKVAGMKACTNYFHLLGSGHVMWLTRRYGNLWRWRNEGVEGQNSVLSLRYKNSTIVMKTRATVPTRTSKRNVSLSKSLELGWHGLQCGNYGWGGLYLKVILVMGKLHWTTPGPQRTMLLKDKGCYPCSKCTLLLHLAPTNLCMHGTSVCVVS